MSDSSGRQVAQTSDGILILVPWRLKKVSGRQVAATPLPRQSSTRDVPAQTSPLALALARAHRWRQLLDSGRYETISELARDLRKAQGKRHSEGEDSSYVTRILKLTLLAPDIVAAILDGREPSGLSLEQMRVIPEFWEEQRTKFGFAMMSDEAS